MADIAELAIRADSGQVRTASKDLKTLEKQAGSSEKRTSMLGSTMLKAAAAFGAAYLAIRKLNGAISKQMDALDRLAKTSDRIGIATEELQAYALAGELAGMSGDTMANSLDRLNRRLAEAGDGAGQAAKGLERLGMNTEEFLKLSPDRRLDAIADSMAGLDDQSQKAQAAFDLFGREGLQMVNVLGNGSDALDDARQKVDELGIAVSRFDAAKIEQANDAALLLSKAFEANTQQIAIGLAPAMTLLAEEMTNVANQGDRIDESMGSAVRSMVQGADLLIRAFSAVGIVLKTVENAGRQVVQTYFALYRSVLEVADGINALIGREREHARTIQELNQSQAEQDVAIAQNRLSMIGLGDTVRDGTGLMEKYNAVLTRMEETAADASKTTGDLTATTRKLNDEAQKLVDKIVEQSIQVSMTEEQWLQYQLGLAGANAEQVKAALEAQALIDNLKEQEAQADRTAQAMSNLGGVMRQMAEASGGDLTAIGNQAADRQAVIEEALKQEAITREEYNRLTVENAKMAEDEISQYQQQQIDSRRAAMLSTADTVGSIIGNMAEVARQGGEKQFENYKRLATAEAMIAGASASIKAYDSAKGQPILGAAMAATIAAVTGAQIAQIQSQTYTAREMGGQVQPGTNVLVGERGPEMLTIGAQGGFVTPNSQIGGGDVSVTNVFQISTGVSETVRAEMVAMAPMFEQKAKEATLTAMRSDRSAARAGR